MVSFLHPLKFTSLDIVLVVDARLAISLLVLYNRNLEETSHDSTSWIGRSNSS